ncbi:sialate O-acetylesterase [uncultured Draconibacterium sp.]|uniref:sialate O-acetylesterase n=1 Tax=uncultured Draconibacterium sp. TaxID=1573823 RepID=UPI0029C64D9D|nr:sialate O-acetylesterase [uncultured Draconibacterium sp.]
MKTKSVLLYILLFAIVFTAKAEVKLPKIFSSNMVLQQGIEIPVWGWANVGEEISVSLLAYETKSNYNTGEKTTVAILLANAKATTDSDGKWTAKLPAQEYGGPYTLMVKGKNTISLSNVMIGEVWVCSGQSNMEFSLAQVKNADEEVDAANHPNIRLFTVPRRVAQFPEDDIESGEWLECTPQTAHNFSAVGYFFGKALQEDLDVPIGLIHSSWGGTVAETWTSAQTIQNDPDFREPMIELQQMDVEEYKKNKEAEIRKILGGEIPTEDEGMQDGKPVWSDTELNDTDWSKIIAPGLWEEQGYIDIDGIGWYRKELDLTEDQTQTNLNLHLGKIDDSDITFLNGIEIGKTENQYDKERVYTIDKKYLNPGKNMIVVRVNDTGGGGGMWGAPEDQYVAIGQEKIDISGDWKFKISKAVMQDIDLGPNSYPTLLFNGMINPIVPFGIKGVIWYQGESNASRAKQYQRVFPNLINDWRKQWNQGDFPFLFVQLANYMKPVQNPTDSEWAELREAQTKTLELPNTGMASAIDIGEADDIHPKNKQDVGKRLALNAFKVAYNKDIVYTGPTFESVEFKDGKAYITFSETGSGLAVKDKYGYVKAFSIAGADRQFYWAKAEVINKNTVVVYSYAVTNPVAVRFGWADNPDDLNLYNLELLPANPFRTDDWPGITK